MPEPTTLYRLVLRAPGTRKAAARALKRALFHGLPGSGVKLIAILRAVGRNKAPATEKRQGGK